MKKILSLITVGCALLATTVTAQVNIGGLPWSISSNANDITNVPEILTTARPDYETAKQGDLNPEIGPYRIGIRVPVSYDFQNHGTISYLPNGKKVWRLQVSIPDAIAMDTYFENFYLPQGVTMFFYNANKRQVAGGYDAKSNNDIGIFASPKVEGSVMNIELDIENGVDLNQIRFNIHMLVANYRGGMTQGLHDQFGPGASTPLSSYADLCTINAICPVAAPYYANSGKAAIHLDEAGYVCSGTMIANTAKDCTPYMLTASHCESSNSVTSSTFNMWKFYFNYENATCNDKVTENASHTQFTTGATFKARSIEDAPPALIGDFLLLQLRDFGGLIKGSYGATFQGWDRLSFPPSIGTRYINFSHPGGDAKKFASFSRIFGNGIFNGGEPNSHWDAQIELGGTQGGSSGSGLIVATTERLIGDLSGGITYPDPCDSTSGHTKLWSKFGKAWNYAAGDGSTTQKLSPWLDPTNSDAPFMNSVKFNGTSCVDVSPGLSIGAKTKLAGSISVYPNPSKGIITVKTSFENVKSISFEIVNVVGTTVASFPATKLNNGEFQLDLSSLPNGIYLLKASDGTVSAGKKIILAK